MSTRGMYLALLVAAVIAGCVLRLHATGEGDFASAERFGELIGAIGVCFLVAALVPTGRVAKVVEIGGAGSEAW